MGPEIRLLLLIGWGALSFNMGKKLPTTTDLYNDPKKLEELRKQAIIKKVKLDELMKKDNKKLHTTMRTMHTLNLFKKKNICCMKMIKNKLENIIKLENELRNKTNMTDNFIKDDNIKNIKINTLTNKEIYNDIQQHANKEAVKFNKSDIESILIPSLDNNDKLEKKPKNGKSKLFIDTSINN